MKEYYEVVGTDKYYCDSLRVCESEAIAYHYFFAMKDAGLKYIEIKHVEETTAHYRISRSIAFA